jgi:hypothetical protein
MSFIVRSVRFIQNETAWPLVGWPVLFGLLMYRSPNARSAAILLATGLICFFVPYLFRSIVVLQYSKYRRLITSMPYVLFATIAAILLFHYDHLLKFLFAAHFSFALGTVFWAASDPMYEMVEWLSFPTEYGRAPDEIRHFDSRLINWPDSNSKVRAHLFRFRYDQDWDYGIVGPFTFSLGGEELEGKSPEAIYAAYLGWYEKENIAGVVEEGKRFYGM